MHGLQGDGGEEEFVSVDKLQLLSSANAAGCQNVRKLPQQALSALKFMRNIVRLFLLPVVVLVLTKLSTKHAAANMTNFSSV